MGDETEETYATASPVAATTNAHEDSAKPAQQSHSARLRKPHKPISSGLAGQQFQPHGGPALDAKQGRTEFWKAIAYYYSKGTDPLALRGWLRILAKYHPQIHELIEAHMNGIVKGLSRNEREELAGRMKLRPALDSETARRLKEGQGTAEDRHAARNGPRTRDAAKGKALQNRNAQHRQGDAVHRSGYLATELPGGRNGLLGFVIGDIVTNQRVQALLEQVAARVMKAAAPGQGAQQRQAATAAVKESSANHGALHGMEKHANAEDALRAERAKAGTSPASPRASKEPEKGGISPGSPRASKEPEKAGVSPNSLRSSKEPVPRPPVPSRAEQRGEALGSAVTMLQSLQMQFLEQQEANKAAAEYQRRLPAITALQQEGAWVLVYAVVDAPAAVDLAAQVAGYRDERTIEKFVMLTIQHGRTRAEALNPPATIRATTSAERKQLYSEKGPKGPEEGRRWRTYLYRELPGKQDAAQDPKQ